MNRRNFLNFFLLLFIIPKELFSSSFNNINKKLWLYREGQERTFHYIKNGKLDTNEYLELCLFLRDKRVDITSFIDFKLVDILYNTQNWYLEKGLIVPIEITSGFRTEYTNELVGGAEYSYHKRGKAVDLRVKGLSIEHLGKLTNYFEAKPILYPRHLHINV